MIHTDHHLNEVRTPTQAFLHVRAMTDRPVSGTLVAALLSRFQGYVDTPEGRRHWWFDFLTHSMQYHRYADGKYHVDIRLRALDFDYMDLDPKNMTVDFWRDVTNGRFTHVEAIALSSAEPNPISGSVRQRAYGLDILNLFLGFTNTNGTQVVFPFSAKQIDSASNNMVTAHG